MAEEEEEEFTLSEEQWQMRTIECVLLANDWDAPQNEELVSGFEMTASSREKLTSAKSKFLNRWVKELTSPVHILQRQSYADFIENGRRSDKARATIAIMTEMSETGTMNAVYNRAKQHCMAVLMVLPPDSGHWCALLDIAGDPLKGGEEDYKVEDVFTEEVMTKIENNSCEVPLSLIKAWFSVVILSISGRYLTPSFAALWERKGLFTPQWCFGGIPLNSVGYLDDFIGFTASQRWNIQNCSVEGMRAALMTSEQQLLLIPYRKVHGKIKDPWSLTQTADDCLLLDLKETPMEYTVIDNNKAQCKVGDVTFEVVRKGQRIPILFPMKDHLDLARRMENAIKESMKGSILLDELMDSMIKTVVNSVHFGYTDEDLVHGEELPTLNSADAWINVIQSLVYRNRIPDLSFVPALLNAASKDETVDWKDSRQHWTRVFINEDAFERVSKKSQLFTQCLSCVGFGMNRDGFTALDWALSRGDSTLVTAAYAYEKSLKSQSSEEDAMAEGYSRWAAQSEYFVRSYLMKQTGGKEAIKALAKALSEFIRDRGDFFAVDLMGIVWHSDDETKRAVLERLMLSVKNTLDYNTVHSDKTGWMWIKVSVLKHPVWLSVDDNGEEKKAEDEDKPPQILFEAVKSHCDEQSTGKGGSQIQSELSQLRKNEPDAWTQLTGYKPELIEASMKVRQDLVGRTPDIKAEEIREIALRFNTLDFNVEKEYDSKAYVMDVLLDAHLVQPHFERMMVRVLSQYGSVRMAGVKKASRVIPKSEEYASEGRDWPHTACVIDLIRCSVTLNTLADFVDALRGFEAYLSAHPAQLSLVRCKNGFAKFDGTDSLPSHYCDVKMNVACKDESGSKCVIGEVQFLLDCIVKAKKKGHELYEVSRMMPLYRGAKKRIDEEWSISKQLSLTVDNSERLTRLLTFFPFHLTLNNLDFSLLFRSEWTDQHLIDQTAKAIVSKSGANDTAKLSDAMISAVSSMPELPSLSIGTTRVMCAIISEAGSESDSVSFMDRLLKEQCGKRFLLPALIGLSGSIKSTIQLPRIRFSGFWPFWRNADPNLTAARLVSAIEGWAECDGFNIGVISNVIFNTLLRAQREADPTLSDAVISLFNLNQDYLLKNLVIMLEGRKGIPLCFLTVLRETRETLPGLRVALRERGIDIKDEDLAE